MSEQQQEAAPDFGVYARVSGGGQRRRETIKLQQTALDRYVTMHGITPYGWYEDEAVSGHWVPFHKRPAAQRLLADIAAGQVNTILVWKLDRFGRNAREILNAVHALNEEGAQLVSMKENVDTRTSAGRFFLTVLSGVAELEYDMIVERTGAGIERRLDKGDASGWMGGLAPYGYKVMGMKQHATLVLDDEEPLGLPDDPFLTAAGVVRLMYQWLVDEKQSTIEIADRLDKMGVPTCWQRRNAIARREGREVRGGPSQYVWRANAVGKMLHNSVYKGVYQFGRRSAHHAGREVVTCDVPALITPEGWEAAQAQLTKNQLQNTGNATYAYLLRGLITCGLCGHAYAGDQNESHGPGYACRNRRKPLLVWGSRELARERRCHGSPWLKAAKLEAEVWHKLEVYLRHPDEALDELAARLRGHADAASDVRAHIAEKQQEQARKQEERDRVLTYFRTGNMTETDLTHQLTLISQEQAKLAKEVATLSDQLGEADAITAKLDAAAALLRDSRDKLDAGPLTFATKRDLVEKLIKRITVKGVRDEATGKLHPIINVKTYFDPDDPTAAGDGGKIGILDSTLGRSRSPRRGMHPSHVRDEVD